MNYSGVMQNRRHWLLLYHIIIAGKQVIYQNRLKTVQLLLSWQKSDLFITYLLFSCAWVGSSFNIISKHARACYEVDVMDSM